MFKKTGLTLAVLGALLTSFGALAQEPLRKSWRMYKKSIRS